VEVLSAWVRECQFDLKHADIHAYGLTCNLTGTGHSSLIAETIFFAPPHRAAPRHRRAKNPANSTLFPCPDGSLLSQVESRVVEPPSDLVADEPLPNCRSLGAFR
jgi:hypothetical protein